VLAARKCGHASAPRVMLLAPPAPPHGLSLCVTAVRLAGGCVTRKRAGGFHHCLSAFCLRILRTIGAATCAPQSVVFLCAGCASHLPHRWLFFWLLFAWWRIFSACLLLVMCACRGGTWRAHTHGGGGGANHFTPTFVARRRAGDINEMSRGRENSALLPTAYQRMRVK